MRLLTPALLAVLLLLAQACGSSQSAEVMKPVAEPAPTGTDDWPQFRGNPLLTGVSETLLDGPLELAWIYQAGESIESSAAIVDGIVYVGSQSGELLALELGTGDLRWKYQAAEAIGESSPAVSAGVVYVGDLAGVLHAVEVKTGAGLWTFETEAEIRSSPVVVDGKVLFGSYDGHLYAVAARTGKLLWKRQTEGPVHSTASVAQGMAHIAGCDGYFRAIRVADGREVFQVLAGAYTGASPPLVGRRTFFGTFDNEVLGVDLRTQQVVWRYEHPTRHFPYNSSAAVAGGKVIVGGRDKMVHALDAGTGKEIWNFRTRARVDSSPVVAGGRVYVGSHDGRLYVLDAADGRKVWEFEAGAPVSASPAIASGRVVVGDQDGRLYCFR